MKEKYVHNLIEERDKEKKALMYEKFQNEYGLKSNRVRQNNQRRVYVGIAAAFVVALLIVAIPLLINNNSFNNDPDIRYYNIGDCVPVELNSTIKNYAAEANKNFLYLDWYDTEEEVQTYLYVNNTDIVCIQEDIVDGETGYVVSYTIFDEFVYVDALEYYEKTCKYIIVCQYGTIYWNCSDTMSMAIFRHEGYIYCIKLKDHIEKNDILHVVEEMFGNTKDNNTDGQ